MDRSVRQILHLLSACAGDFVKRGGRHRKFHVRHNGFRREVFVEATGIKRCRVVVDASGRAKRAGCCADFFAHGCEYKSIWPQGKARPRAASREQNQTQLFDLRSQFIQFLFDEPCHRAINTRRFFHDGGCQKSLPLANYNHDMMCKQLQT